ncbi:MAG: PAS domain S-box protein [Candidatus Hodarchaeota archaeon]
MTTPSLSFEESQYILENIRDIIFTLSPDGRIKSLTREFENLTGWSREEWIGKHFLDIIHPADTEVVIKGFEATIEGETIPPYHARIFAKSGAILTLEAKPTPQIVDGQVTGYLGIARDITDRVQAEEALRASEQQYRNVINSMGDPIHVIDKDLNIILSNLAFSSWLKQLDLDSKLVGKTVREAFPFLPNKVIDEYHTVFSTGQTLVTEEGTTINGETYFTETRKIPIIQQEEVVQILTIIRDISDRKNARQALLESESKYSAIVENASDCVFIIQDGVLKFANKALSTISGYSLKELIGMPFLDLVPEDIREDVDRRVKLHFNGVDLSPILERQLLCKDGTIKDIEVGNKVIQYQQHPAITGIARDITERKKIEEQLRKSESKYRDLIENLTNVVLEADAEGNFIFLSPQTFDLFGYHPEELIGKNGFDSIHPDDREGVLKRLREAFAGERIFNHEYRIKHKDGHYVSVVASGKAIEQESGFRLIFVIRDLTKRKRMQKALDESEERFKGFMNGASDAFSLWDSELNLIDVNKKGLETFLSGTKKKEIIGKNILEFHSHSEDIKHYYEVLRTGIPFVADGIASPRKYGDIELSVKAFKVGTGLGIISTDITEHKRMERALRESEERLRSFMDEATDAFSLWDSELNLVDCNKKGLATFPPGTKKIDVIGKNMRDFITDPMNDEPYKEVLRTGTPFFADRIAPHEIFGELFLSVKAFKVGNGLGLITTDITSRKKMENILRENEEKFRSIFENSPIGMALVSLDFKFSKVNAALCRMLEYDERKLTQMTFLDLTLEEYHDINKKYAKKLVDGKISVYQTEEKYLKKNQEITWARVTISLLRDDKGAPMNYLAMVEDITALKQKEEDIKRQLLKYNVEDGNIYLVTEETPTLSQTVFKDLTSVGYEGFIISRTPERDYRTQVKEDYDFFWLTEKNGYKKILNFVENVPNKSVILIDRLEYLFLKEGPKNAMRFVYKLRETTYLKNLIAIMSIDNTTLSEREIQILEKETQPIEPRFMAKIPEEFLEVLRFVYQQNNLGVKPSYSDIGEELQISKPTVRKRIKQLIATGYLIEHKKGKMKILEISGKGRSLFIK